MTYLCFCDSNPLFVQYPNSWIQCCWLLHGVQETEHSQRGGGAAELAKSFLPKSVRVRLNHLDSKVSKRFGEKNAPNILTFILIPGLPPNPQLAEQLDPE